MFSPPALTGKSRAGASNGCSRSLALPLQRSILKSRLRQKTDAGRSRNKLEGHGKKASAPCHPAAGMIECDVKKSGEYRRAAYGTHQQGKLLSGHCRDGFGASYLSAADFLFHSSYSIIIFVRRNFYLHRFPIIHVSEKAFSVIFKTLIYTS